MTKAHKEAIIKHIEDEKLLDSLIKMTANFNPLDDDFCETYEAVKSEILKRMQKEG